MKTTLQLALLTLASMVNLNLATSLGALEGACADMMPNHPGTQPSTEPCPYKLTAEKHGANEYHVTLAINPDFSPPIQFKGFMIMAVNGSDYPVGQFNFYDHDFRAQHLKCSPIYPSATITHVVNSLKEKYEVDWEAPEGWDPEAWNVTFKATVVQSIDTYWVGLTAKAGVGMATASALLITLSALLQWLH